MKRGERLEDDPILVTLCTNCTKAECLSANCKEYAALEAQIKSKAKQKSSSAPNGKKAPEPAQLPADIVATFERMSWKALFYELFPEATYPPRPCMFISDLDLGCRGESLFNCAKCAQQKIPQHVYDTFRKLIYKEVVK